MNGNGAKSEAALAGELEAKDAIATAAATLKALAAELAEFPVDRLAARLAFYRQVLYWREEVYEPTGAGERAAQPFVIAVDRALVDLLERLQEGDQ